MKIEETIEVKILTFFKVANDEEIITAKDCAIKGWGHPVTCSQTLRRLYDRGLLRREWKDNGFVYTRA